eukprot:1421196-Prorocentrum_lima.AAC.1
MQGGGSCGAAMCTCACCCACTWKACTWTGVVGAAPCAQTCTRRCGTGRNGSWGPRQHDMSGQALARLQ